MHTSTPNGTPPAGSPELSSNASTPPQRIIEPLDPQVLQALRGLDSGILANAIETFKKRLRNEGFMDHTIRSFCPQLEPMVGYAATLQIRGSAPPTAGGRYPERTDWWEYILSLPSPRIAVVQDIGTHPGLGSLIGAVHMSILRALQCVGVVTNGAVRDLGAAETAGFHYFAGNLAVSHAYLHIVEIGKPVQIGGLTVHSGDLLHGDRHGVQSVPLEVAASIPPVAAELAAKEQALIDLCQSPDFSLEKLRVALGKS